MVLTASLKLKGYHALCASGGVEGLQVFRRARVDAVILDMRMPDMHGKEVLAELRALDPTVRVLGITGYDGGSNFPWLDQQQLAMLHKPFSPQDLWAALERLLA